MRLRGFGLFPRHYVKKAKKGDRPKLMESLYSSDAEILKDPKRVKGIAGWLSLQAEDVLGHLDGTVDTNLRRRDSSVSLISGFFRSKTGLVKSLLNGDSATEERSYCYVYSLRENQKPIHDEADGTTLIEVDPTEEINHIEEEVMKNISTDVVIDDISVILESVHV